MVQASLSSRHRLAGGGASRRSPTVPLTAVDPDKTEQSGFCSFELELSVPVWFMWQYILVTPLENRLLHTRETWRVETPTPMDPTSIRTTLSSLPSTPWRKRPARCSNFSHQSRGALPLTLWSDVVGDSSQGHHFDHHPQGWGNTRGTT
jgi:hypothetical protein